MNRIAKLFFHIGLILKDSKGFTQVQQLPKGFYYKCVLSQWIGKLIRLKTVEHSLNSICVV